MQQKVSIRLAAAASLVLACGLLAAQALAQHATAFDLEDGARVYERSCATCHGPEGDLIAGIDFGRGVYRRPLTDLQIAEIILLGIPNTPMPPTPNISEEQAERVVAYLRSMPEARNTKAVAGDPARGRELFEGKGECMDCHRVNARGSRLGPDLTRIALARRAAELEQSLIDPQAEVQPQNRFYTVTPKGGEPMTGRLLNHDTFTVQMMGPDEELHSFDKAELEHYGFVDSTMPPATEKLTPQEIADVVSYLVTLRGETTP